MPSESDRDIIKDNLIMGGLYSCFGFLGIFLVVVWEHFMNLPNAFGKTPKDPLVTGMEIFVIGVSIYMFWFSTRVYKDGVKHDREMRKLFADIDKNLERMS